MWKFWRKKPVEVIQTLATLNEIEAQFPHFDIAAISFLIRDRIESEPEKVILSIRNDKLAPKTLVYLVITNVLDRELSSGRYHYYRGLLNNTGQSLLALWDHAVDELQFAGFHSEDEAKKDKEWIRQQIRGVG